MSATGRSWRRQLGVAWRAASRRRNSPSPNQPPNSAVQSPSGNTSTANAADPRQDPLHQRAFQEFQTLHAEEAMLLKSHIDPERSVKWHEKTVDAINDELTKAKADRRRVKLRDGRVLIVSEVLGKFVAWVQKMIEVGDVAVQFDPVHAALPWAAFRFILKAAVGYKEAEAAVWEGIERVCRGLIWVNGQETLYLRSKSKDDSPLAKALIALYVQLFTVLAKYLKELKVSSTARLLRSPFFSESDFRQCMDSIDQKKKSVKEISQQVMSEVLLEQSSDIMLLLEEMSDLNTFARRTYDLNEKMYKRLEAREQNDILDWISAIPYATHFAQASTKILPGTGQWLLTKPEFRQWKSSDKSEILRIHGKAGSGKSTLLSIILKQLQRESEEDGSPWPVYFYCARTSAEPLRAQPLQILRCLLRQLSELDDCRTHQSICQRYDERNRKGSLESDAEIVQMCIESIDSRGSTSILIDALDESDPISRDVLLCGLARLANESTQLVKIFVTSRDDRNEGTILNYPELVILPQDNADDIETYLDTELTRMEKHNLILRGQLPSDLRDHIKHQISEKANGMFRWVALQLQALKFPDREEALRERVGKLDVDLTKSYRELFDFEIKHLEDRVPDEKDVTLRTFKWLMVAQRQLPSREFLLLVEQTDTKNVQECRERLIRDCFSLVEYDAAADAFRFCHLSVREFFESADFRKAYPEFEEPVMHAMAATRCLFFVERDEGLFSRFYDALYWTFHAWKAGEQRGIGCLREKLDHVLKPQSGTFVTWKKSLARKLRISEPDFWPLIRNPKSLHPLMIAAMWNFYEHVPDLCQNEDIKLLAKMRCETTSDIHPRDSDEYGLLGCAVQQGHIRVLESLFESGIGIGIGRYECGADDALVRAVCLGHVQITRLLLKRFAGVYRQKHLGRALWSAVKAPHSAELTPLLLDHGADVNWCGGRDYDTPLRGAASYGCSDSVKLLIERGADPSAKDRYDRDALWEACFRGREKAAATLLKCNTDVDTQDKKGVSALMAAARNGHERVVRLLLTAGANTKSVDEDKTSALQHAVKSDKKGVVSVIRDHYRAAGREVEQSEVCSVLNMVARRGWICAQLIRLISTEIGIPVGFDFDQEALDVGIVIAAEHGVAEDVDFLITKGANVNPLNNAGEVIALIAAVLKNYPLGRSSDQIFRTVALLIQAGADVNATASLQSWESAWYSGKVDNHIYNSKGLVSCALAAASRAGDYAILELLLKSEVQPTKRQQFLDCALLHGAKHNDPAFVELLLAHGAAVNALFSLAETGSPLAAAAKHGRLHIVSLLLDRGAKVDLCSKASSTAFAAACQGGHSEIAELLLSRGADPSISTAGYAIAFSNAAETGNVTIIEMLLKRVISINTIDKELESALIICCWHGSVEGVKMLLGYKADTTIASSNGRNALHTAIDHGHNDIVEVLLDHGADANLASQPADDVLVTPLIWAVRRGQLEIMQMLLDHGADANTLLQDESALAAAVIKNDNEALKMLLEYGANANLGFGMGLSILDLAVVSGNANNVELLLEHGADPNLVDSLGNPRLYYCLQICSGFDHRFDDGMNILRLLCKHGASLTDEILGGNVLDYAVQMLKAVLAQLNQEKRIGKITKLQRKKRFYLGSIMTLRVFGAERSKTFLRRQEKRMERKLEEDACIEDLSAFFIMAHG